MKASCGWETRVVQKKSQDRCIANALFASNSAEARLGPLIGSIASAREHAEHGVASIVKPLAKILNDAKALQKEYGQLAKPIRIRMATLRAAPSLAHVPTTRPERRHQLSQDRDEQFAVDIKGQWRLVFSVDNNPIPRKSDGGIDLVAVTAVLITEISDHYK